MKNDLLVYELKPSLLVAAHSENLCARAIHKEYSFNRESVRLTTKIPIKYVIT